MLTLRPAAARGAADLGWLRARYSFSFADYHDPAQMGVSDLRVLNQDVIAPAGGFGRHGHRDMEIITYVLRGKLEHSDSLGNRGIIVPGEIQRMSAGTGIEHAEFNASATDPLELLQIWILPGQRGLTPGYEQQALPQVEGNGFQAIATPDGGQGCVRIHQDATLHRGVFAPGGSSSHTLAAGRMAWVQAVQGAMRVNGIAMSAGDGLRIEDERHLAFIADDAAEVLLFDLRAPQG